ncbi:MAG: gliding motility lipoprotein GldK [Bacteroidetes bacterium]|nr:gliding motility lipoprotein GldK [Bacteroidota bacterium]
MRNIFLIFFVFITLSSCKPRSYGDLVGVKQKNFYETKPHGMVLIPSGAFFMGSADEDIFSANSEVKKMTVNSFWMDQTEISNSEYQQFIAWVKDSIVRTELAKLAISKGNYSSVKDLPTSKNEASDDQILSYLPLYDSNELVADSTDLTPYEQYLVKNSKRDFIALFNSTKNAPDDAYHYHLPLNRDVEVFYSREDYPTTAYAELFEETIYLPEQDWSKGKRSINSEILNYRFSYEERLKSSALSSGVKQNSVKHQVLNIYPDTTVWLNDFKYSYNDPMHKLYFSHPAYFNHPVIGINWHQARAFAHWRTKIKADFAYPKTKKNYVQFPKEYRLPTEAEWEYAARGGLESATYPWGGPYVFDERGNFLANFKPSRGDYASDGAIYTVEVDAFQPNDYGLYNMSGNVSEWTDTDKDFKANNGLLPYIKPDEASKKVIRGGSWKDVAYYLRVASRDYEHADSARSFVGFRLVSTNIE